MRINAEKLAERLGVEYWDETVLAKTLKRVPDVGKFGPWLAGGAVRRTISKQSLESDFDFFFANEKQREIFEDELVGMGAGLKQKNDKNSLYILPSKMVDAGEDFEIYLPEMKIQVIHFAYFQTAEALIDSFDFTICQFAYDGTDLIMGNFSLWDLAAKKLVPHKLSFATSSLRRMLKYTRQGFTICSGGLANMLEQVVEDPTIIHSDVVYID